MSDSKGIVLDSSVLVNPATGRAFQWARVRTFGGELDLVADPEVVTGAFVTAGVVTGSFWLSGRVTRPLSARPSGPQHDSHDEENRHR